LVEALRRWRAAVRHVTNNAVAYLALFVALGGTSYAATQLDGGDIKNRSLSARDIKRNSLTSNEIRDHSLRSRDFLVGDLPQGPQGDKGGKGDKGDRGDTGGVDTTILWAVVRSDATLARGRHAVSSQKLQFPMQPPATGVYIVTFDRDVTQCAYVATEGGDTGVVSAGISDAHQIQVHPSTQGGANSVLVTTSRRNFTNNTPETLDLGFHLIVAC
jgi:hypothetical protein